MSSYRSTALIAIIAFGVLFSALFASSQIPTTRHDPKVIPTEPKITQIQALEIAVRAIKLHNSNLSDSNIKLWFSFYNFTVDDEQKHPENYKIGYKWPVPTIRENPDLLHPDLVFIHANGTVYRITESSTGKSTYESCDLCGGFNPPFRMRNHLIWRLDLSSQLSAQLIDVDAETGAIVNPDFDKKPTTPKVEIYDNSTKPITIRQLLNPPMTTNIEIVDGAAHITQEKHFVPKLARGIITLSNRVIWTNEDSVPHTVTPENEYSNPYTGKFDSGLLDVGQSYEYTFMDAGLYAYHCQIHPFMAGAVVIVPGFY